MKTILVLGANGYIGWALVQRLAFKYPNYTLVCVDNYSREKIVESEMDSFSATPVRRKSARLEWLNSFFKNVFWYEFDYVRDFSATDELFSNYKFDTIVNLAHQPSGPYSQKSLYHSEYTLTNNVLGTNKILWLIKDKCPDAHYITIGSTGEYSHNLDVPIEEGYFTLPGATDKSIFPRRTNSIYHTSKIASTYITDTLSRMWKIKSTDIMQAVVFGAYTNEIDITKNYTRMDTDAAFGTVCNKFIVQAVLGQDLTVYGEGNHKRGFIALNDSIQALEIAIERDASEDGFYEDYSPRVWNQLSYWYSMNELATIVQRIALKNFNIKVNIEHIENPRHENTESPKHYSYKMDTLESLGYIPTRTSEEEIAYTMDVVFQNRTILDSLKKNFKNHIRFK